MKILKFSAAWCGPCRSMSKALEGHTLPVPLVEVDIDDAEAAKLVAKYGIRNVPTLVMVDDNEEFVSSLVGAKSVSQILDWIAVS